MPRTNDWTPQSGAVLFGHAEGRQTVEQRDRLAICFNLIKKPNKLKASRLKDPPTPMPLITAVALRNLQLPWLPA